METVLVQITNHNALGLLQKLEELHLIKLLKTDVTPGQKLSEKFAGKLPADISIDLEQHITQSRNEWESNT